MKRLLYVCSFALLAGTIALPGIAAAQSSFTQNVGCGLGSIAMKERDTILHQVLAVTTNGTFGNQTFGITSGTLECQKPAKFAENEKLNVFVAANMDNLAMDMAAGHGESLVTLAELMEVPAEGRDGFYSSLQQNFKKIYTSSSIESADVIDNIAKVAL